MSEQIKGSHKVYKGVLRQLAPNQSVPFDVYFLEHPQEGSRFVYFEETTEDELKKVVTSEVQKAIKVYLEKPEVEFRTENSSYMLVNIETDVEESYGGD